MTDRDDPLLRWTPEEFVDAWTLGAFDGRHRVQLVDGEVWELGPIKDWHGRVVPELAHLLRSPGVVVTTQTLPMPRSMPDPDVWVRRAGAAAIGAVRGYETWSPADVLVVEVSDATLRADLTSKARVYALGGVEHYWVVGREALHVHTQPSGGAYAQVEVLGPDAVVPLPYAPDRVLAVRDLLGN